ncbi:DUF1624 domain-containing protein [Chitinophaga barathri]|uniref:DUF1624 domain-containing protein n=1 Tax=Chitinophaga barathri TaxID=1647451 RepID=A0A3N4MFG0_9BACT|nr:heparan-alpha-glucosaminide N-acetyltransferase domain-containing protein [Chitinophaga barathri]RPD42752.1 DUF1624 domain-containing protein [Chitinophaga barathri]
MQPIAFSRERVYSIDVLRGLIMILMALDHVRDFFHTAAFTSDPLDPQTTYPALYMTRWITHFCAPIFVFLSGMSVQLMNGRKTKAEISRFLLSRGLWLILIEVTVVSFGLTFNPLMNTIFLQVIWAIGVSFLFLALFVFLPWQAVLGLGLLVTFGHNILNFWESQPGFKAGPLWEFAHLQQFTFFEIFPGHGVIVFYPFLPWVGIMMLGYGLGRLFQPDVTVATRKQVLITAGLAMIGSFFVLRAVNVYGDPRPWQPFPTLQQTIFSFMNVAKYPPSLMYTCATLGPGLLALAAFEHARGRFAQICKVYGSVPFFYYIIHFYAIHLLCMILFFIHGYGVNDIVDPQVPFLFRPVDFGYPLWVVYIIWIALVAALYKPCKWYSEYKRTHRQWWLSYL